MKLRNTLAIFLLSAWPCLASTNIVTPLLNGQLQGNLNASATNSLTNVASIVFADGSTQSTAGGGGGGSGTILTPTGVKTSAYNAVTNDFIPVDTTSGAVTITLPTAPANKSIIGIKKIKGANAVLLSAGGSDVFNIAGGSQTGTMILTNQAITFQYTSSPAIWYSISDDTPLGSLINAGLTNSGNNLTTGNNSHSGSEQFTGNVVVTQLGTGNLTLSGGLDQLLPLVLSSGQIPIGTAGSAVTNQSISGDATLAASGALTLAATGTAGTYGQATFDAKGRETSGTVATDIAHGGTGQTTAISALQALAGAFTNQQNNFGTSTSQTNSFVSQIVSTGQAIYLQGPTIIPATSNSSWWITDTNNSFKGWRPGYQIVLGNAGSGTTNAQFWVNRVLDANHIQCNVRIGNRSNQGWVYAPPSYSAIWVNGGSDGPYGMNQAYVGNDGTVGIASGDHNGNSLNGLGGGIRLENWQDSIHLTTFNDGTYGEGFVATSDTNNENYLFFISDLAPFESFIMDKFGLMHLPGGVSTAGTNAGIITATGWTNTTGTNIQLNFDATASTITNWNSGGIPWRTNTALTANSIYTVLQAGAKITASGGLVGAWTVW